MQGGRAGRGLLAGMASFTRGGSRGLFELVGAGGAGDAGGGGGGFGGQRRGRGVENHGGIPGC